MGSAFQDAAASGPLLLALGASILAGLVSFASPCCLPLVPGYLSYLAGVAGAETAAAGRTAVPLAQRWRVTAAAVAFVAGFTVVFVAATASVFGVISVLALNQSLLQRVGGVVTIVMGVAFLGYVPLLQRDTRPHPRPVRGLIGAPMLGAVFGLGWTPCLGPTLAGVLSVAAGTQGTTAARGVALIVAYCLGLGVPFIVLAMGSTVMMSGVGWFRRHARAVQMFGGITLIAVGVALVTGQWEVFTLWLRSEFVSSYTTPI
ncbi:MAG: cytochrome c biogenesis protein CcdA [Gordonia polyisoprenivorans]|nr:cytochrome c biogenesis protein CcdA [Gordonia polyisoprenivorans]